MSIIKKSLSEQIIEAATIGSAEQLNILIKQSKNLISCSDYTEALKYASLEGHAECVKLLIPVSDPKANESIALLTASNCGHAECVKLLIPVSNVKANNSQALSYAAVAGHLECVKLLIPVSNPKSNKSRALLWAAEVNRYDCIKLLLPYSDISKWNDYTWQHVDHDIKQNILSYYSKVSLMCNISTNNNKTKKSHKI